MFCPNCGTEVADQAVTCANCGGAVGSPAKVAAQPNQPVTTFDPAAKSRIAYILLGVFLGGLGIHNFYAGYTGKAIAQLLISVVVGGATCGLGTLAVWIWVIVEICTVTKDASGKALQ